MAIKPILFNTEMVRAILDGRKSCTRRICKDANEYVVPDMDFFNADKRTYAVHNFADKEHTEQLSTAERSCPICPGDILYVRETWGEGYEEGTYIYRADDKLADLQTFKEASKIIYHPSIHMPKEAARIWLKVTDVRVERLQEITIDEIRKEGLEPRFDVKDKFSDGIARGRFLELWNSTIKKSDLDRYGWNANPYVFVIEFIRIDKPEEI